MRKNIKVINLFSLYSTLMKMLKIIRNSDLICMDDYADDYGYRVDLVYAREDNLLFGERIYKKDAKLWLYKDLAKVVFKASEQCFREKNIRFILYDGLRTIEAQKAMIQTKRVLDNPQWIEKPRMLSLAGEGGHPRAMAIDIGLEYSNGVLIDMGSDFDCFSKKSHRDYRHDKNIQYNRNILNSYMERAAKFLGIPLFLLPQEWWDFRLPVEIYEQYAPISESNIQLLN